MPAIRSSQAGMVLLVTAVSGLVLAGCGGAADSPGTTAAGTAGNAPATTTPTTSAPGTTARPTTTTAAPTRLTQAAWLAGFTALEKRMTAAVTADGSGEVTSQWMRRVATQLGTCTAGLSRLGPVDDTLQLVLTPATQGCARYQEAAKCLAPGKVDSPDLPRCFDAINKGASLFATAEAAAAILH